MSVETMKIIQIAFSWINIFYIIYLVGYATFLFLSVVVGALTLYEKRKEVLLKNVIPEKYYVPISIIVPAHNEDVTVVETVKSLLAQDYTLYEIIVVNDGSTDKTADYLIEAFEMKEIQRPIRRRVKCQPVVSVYEAFGQKVSVTLINKEKGGKADALNMGINASNYPYFICMDADSMLQYDSLQQIVRPVLENKNVIAVGGIVRPANGAILERGHVIKYRLPRNILACMQLLEYDRTFLASRIFLDRFNGSMIISGAFGLFQKDIVIGVGGYDPLTMGEDMELVVKMHEYCILNGIPYNIKYATNAICWSQVPEKLGDLCKQRRRWHYGLIQSMYSHTRMIGKTRNYMVSWISYPYFVLYELYSPYIEVFGVISMVVAYLVDLLNMPYMIMFFAIYTVFGLTMTLTSFFSRVHTIDLPMRFTDVIKAFIMAFFEITVLRFVMVAVRFWALIASKKNKQWGKIERQKLNQA